MKKSCIILVLLMALSLMGCAKTSTNPEPVPPSTAASAVPTQSEGTVPRLPDEILPVSEERPVLGANQDSNFVRAADYIPNAVIELKYASSDNFTGKLIYGFQDAYLRYGTVRKLMQVSDELAERGLSIKVWDAFRPYSAQLKLWEICPDGNFVSNPATGSNSHCRGGTVDLTLVDAQGNTVEMPSGYDDFSSLADRDYSDCTETAARNALLLQETMEKYGFKGYAKEWWHFSDTDEYPVDKVFDPAFIARWYADCQEFISLRTAPSTAAPVITRVPAKAELILLGWDGDFALVDHHGDQGYVLGSYIKPVFRAGSPEVGTPELVGRPAVKELESSLGTLHLNLHIGYGYSIYMPDTGWSLTQTSHEGDTPMFEDIWTNTTADDAEIKVAYYGGQSPEQARALILEQEKDYALEVYKQGDLGGTNGDGTKTMEVWLYPAGNGVLTVSWYYRMEDTEEIEALFWLLSETFAVTEYFWEAAALPGGAG